MANDKKNATASFAKGDPLYKHGEPVKYIYLVQSGLVSLSVNTPTGKVEISQATAPQVVGIEALHGSKTYETSAFAMNDTAAIELPIGAVAQSLSQCSPTLKLILTGLINKLTAVQSEHRTFKLEGDSTPCPPALTAKLFATVFHVVSYSGTPKGDALRIVWPAFRKYCQRVFMESPIRLEQLIYLLAHMGFAELEMQKSDTDPDGPEELGFVRFKDLPQLESFSEFFKIRFKTLGPEGAMELKDPCLQAGEVLLRSFGTRPTDSNGEVMIPLSETMATIRAELAKPNMKATELEALTGRGLPAILTGEGLRFSPVKVKRMFQNWRILAKITEWNHAGRAPGAPDPDPNKKKESAKG